jgi:hypothetical protein
MGLEVLRYLLRGGRGVGTSVATFQPLCRGGILLTYVIAVEG